MDNPVLNPIVKPITQKQMKPWMLVVIGVLVVAVGIGSGWLLSGKKGLGESEVATGATKTSSEAGIVDEKTFKDTATGVLKTGGIKCEGTHHLERDGGASQNVYLTSTVID